MIVQLGQPSESPSEPGAPRDPLRPRNLTTELAARIAGDITGGRIGPGERLPTEQELMTTYGVSRTVVREAVSALRTEGLVQTRQGVGAFVAPDVRLRPFRIDLERLQSISEVVALMELRMGIEIEAAGFAAERRSVADLRSIDRALGAIDAALARGDAAVDADFGFHRAIAEAARNEHFARFLEYLGRFIIPRQSVRAGQGGAVEQAAYLRRVQVEHRQIQAAIADGAPDAARQAMRSHLSNSRERYKAIEANLRLQRKPARRSRRT
jgi:GntR family transcriptional regulator, transcriptional repressor for pyruvate dehydrogenase complex